MSLSIPKMKEHHIPAWVTFPIMLIGVPGFPIAFCGVIALLFGVWQPARQELLGFLTFCALVFFVDICIVIKIAVERITEEIRSIGAVVGHVSGQLTSMEEQLVTIEEKLT